MSILSNFDPTNQTHVQWLARLTQDVMSLSAVNSKNNKIMKYLDNNPIGKFEGTSLDFAETHMMLCNKYAIHHLLKNVSE